MDKLSLIFLGVTAFIILVSIIMGMVRGTGRSIVRLALVVASGLVAYLFFRKVTELVLGINVQGMPLDEFMFSKLPEEMDFAKENAMPLIKLIIGVLCYFLIFGAVQLLSWLIIFPIIKIFVKKSKKVGKASTLVGGAVGAVQALFLVFALVMPMMGFVGSVNQITKTPKDASDTPILDASKYVDYDAYENSAVGKFVIKINGKFYANIATVNIGGETYTLSGQIEAIQSTARLAFKVTETINNVQKTLDDAQKALEEAGKVGESVGLTKDAVTQVKDLFSDLSEMQDGMSEEAKKSTNKIIKDAAASLGESYGVDLDLSDVDVMDTDFEKESKVLDDVQKYQDSESADDVNITEVVKDLSESSLVLPVLDNSGVTIPTNEEQKAEVESAIADLEKEGNTDAATIDKIKKLFGLEVGGETGGEQ